MNARRVLSVAGAVFVCAFAWPVAGSAEHVSIQASAGALLKERVDGGWWIVEVTYSIQCLGVTRGVQYFGDGSLVDDLTREKLFLGGTSRASGTTRQIIKAKPYWRRMHPEYRVSCAEDLGGHGAGPIDVIGGGVEIPPLDGDSGRGSGGSAGGGGGASGSDGDPTEPTRAGACSTPLVGTDGPDALTGTRAGDIIFGRSGRDAIRGLGGHDCLVGGAGNDTLRGEAGDDRLAGGRGADTLLGGAGANVYDAGAGNDIVNSVNGRIDQVRCGSGTDRATVDRRDQLTGCERVTRSGR